MFSMQTFIHSESLAAHKIINDAKEFANLDFNKISPNSSDRKMYVRFDLVQGNGNWPFPLARIE